MKIKFVIFALILSTGSASAVTYKLTPDGRLETGHGGAAPRSEVERLRGAFVSAMANKGIKVERFLCETHHGAISYYKTNTNGKAGFYEFKITEVHPTRMANKIRPVKSTPCQ